MSWNAAGNVQNGNTDNLLWTPPRDTLGEDAAAQADFLLECLNEAFTQNVVQGELAFSMGGHTDAEIPDEVGPLNSLFFSLSPATQDQAIVDTEQV